MCAYVCENQRSLLNAFLNNFPSSWYLRQFFSEPGTQTKLDKLSSEPQESSSLCLHRPGITDTYIPGIMHLYHCEQVGDGKSSSDVHACVVSTLPTLLSLHSLK